MANKGFDFKSGIQLSARSRKTWRVVQAAVWLAGATILFCLIFYPSIGILLFWNILIPVAPALFVLATGIWRNVCPLATTNLFPRHRGLSKRKKLSSRQLSKLNLVAVISLFVLVPLRHALFNTNGMATALLILSMAVLGTSLGFVYEWKSVWCSGLCPVHPVEKLYGGNVLMPVPNAHCNECMNCVIPCPDSTPNIQPNTARKNVYQKISGMLITGGLPGFIWGWFHVPDAAQLSSLSTFFEVYKMPLAGFTVTLILYAILYETVSVRFKYKLTGIFAAAGVSCYYWYRIPSLFGFGSFAKDGLLVNLQEIIPAWMIPVITITVALLFFYRLVFSRKNQISWVVRPPYAERASRQDVYIGDESHKEKKQRI